MNLCTQFISSKLLTLHVLDCACTFNSLIKHHYKFDKAEEVNQHIQLNYEEQNTLRYTVGYIVNALIKKLKHFSSSAQRRDDVLFNRDGWGRRERHSPCDRGKKVNRGGLKQIGDMTYGVFESMELEIRRFFKRDPSQLRNFKTELQIILLNDDVQFFWALVLHVAS